LFFAGDVVERGRGRRRGEEEAQGVWRGEHLQAQAEKGRIRRRGE
jgi:hypothetical protein